MKSLHSVHLSRNTLSEGGKGIQINRHVNESMKLYLLQIDLSTVHHSCGVRESKPRLQVLQFNLQGADLLIAVQQVRFCHGVERLRNEERRRQSRN